MPWLTSNGGGLWLLFTLVEFTSLLWIVKYAVKRDMIDPIFRWFYIIWSWWRWLIAIYDYHPDYIALYFPKCVLSFLLWVHTHIGCECGRCWSRLGIICCHGWLLMMAGFNPPHQSNRQHPSSQTQVPGNPFNLNNARAPWNWLAYAHSLCTTRIFDKEMYWRLCLQPSHKLLLFQRHKPNTQTNTQEIPIGQKRGNGAQHLSWTRPPVSF